MLSEFQTPKDPPDQTTPETGGIRDMNLGSTDRVIGSLIAALLVAMMLWVGNATQTAQVDVARLNEKFDAFKESRVQAFNNIERRLEKIERFIDEQKYGGSE